MKMRMIMLLALGATLFAGQVLAQDSVTLAPTKDNTLYEDAAGLFSNGVGDYFFTGQSAALLKRRGVLAFDVSGIPAGSKIISATLTLNMSRTITGPFDVGLYRLLADWGEGGSDGPGEEGAGAPSQINDATWIHTFYPGSLWTNPGGDYVGLCSASTVVDVVGSYSWSGTQMAIDVQKWVDGTAGNYGWIVIGDEGLVASAKRFDSVQNPTVANRPELVVTYSMPADQIPTLSQWGLILLGGLLVLAGIFTIARRKQAAAA